MASEAREIVEQGAPGQPLEERRIAYMRYVGQGHEIVVEVPSRRLEASDGAALERAFDSAYESLFGRTIPTMEVEVLTWALTLSAPAQPAAEPSAELKHEEPTAQGLRELFDAERVDYARVPIYLRDNLSPGMHIAGPALVVEDQTTTVVTANFDLEVNAFGYLDIQRRAD